MSDFVHLHLHSQYSLLDGANRLDDVLDAAAEAEMPAMALTDHGNMFGAIEFYDRARKRGINPILGMEAYVAQGSRLERDPQRASSNHLVLLARNLEGYRNLLKLTSHSYLDGFYYKPRIDHALLEEHSGGLMALSACLKGEINERILGRREAEAEELACTYRDLFGEGNYYLEMQDHGIEEQRASNEVLRRISSRTGIPLVVTNDCHYLRRDDAFAHDVLLCIGTQRMVSDPERMKYASEEFYLKSGSEMFERFPGNRDAIENTLGIAERCRVELDHGGFHLPEFPIPDGYTEDSYFRKVCEEGLAARLEELDRRGIVRRHEIEVYRQRLETEIGVIERMGFPGYFLIVWDFVRHARENSVPVGPGRGSAAGSLVAYALEITDVDPLQYDLLFERFLNPERVSLPDIDIDFCMRRRGEIIQYVNEKYGRDKVAQIITFGTLGAKAAVRDVARVLGVPYATADRVAKMIPDMTKSVTDFLKNDEALAREVASDPEVKQIVEVGGRLEGLTRHASLHAAGVVIAPRPIHELVPLYKTSKDEIVTQWDKDVVERLGLLKMDFLGLRTLTVLDDTLAMLRLQGIELDLDGLPLDDGETYRLFSEGRTSGIFQFESSGMRDLLRQVRPSQFEDLAALNALYRPGALEGGTVKQYVDCKKGKRKVSYILPEIAEILEETHGVIVYQEQVMQIAGEVAGFTMGEADILRKAMGKKDRDVMEEQKEKFLVGAVERGHPRAKAAKLWEQIAPFAGYGFNKSHSVAYALLAYKTAYLKAHYPVAFMGAMLTSEMASKDNVAKYFQECREMGISVLPPDVNESSWSFTAVGDAIRFGLGAIKGVGESAVEAILEARQRVGRFESFYGFLREVDVQALNHKVFEALVRSGSLDGFGYERSALAASLDRMLEYATRKRRDADTGQESLFGEAAAPPPEPSKAVPPWPDADRLRYEKETLGFYLTGHPLEDHAEDIRRLATHTSESVQEATGQEVAVAGVVTRMTRRKIKSGANAGRMMGKFQLEDVVGTIPVAVFADALEKYGRHLEDEAIVIVKGTARDRGAGVEITLEDVVPLESAASELIDEVEVALGSGLTAATMLELRDVLVEHVGDVPVRFRIATEGREVRVAPEERFRVRFDPDLVRSVESILGQGSVTARQHRSDAAVH